MPTKPVCKDWLFYLNKPATHNPSLQPNRWYFTILLMAFGLAWQKQFNFIQRKMRVDEPTQL